MTCLIEPRRTVNIGWSRQPSVHRSSKRRCRMSCMSTIWTPSITKTDGQNRSADRTMGTSCYGFVMIIPNWTVFAGHHRLFIKVDRSSRSFENNYLNNRRSSRPHLSPISFSSPHCQRQWPRGVQRLHVWTRDSAHSQVESQHRAILKALYVGAEGKDRKSTFLCAFCDRSQSRRTCMWT